MSSEQRTVGDRVPPHSEEAEVAVLGCCLLDPKEALSLAVERVGGREVFYDLRHQALFVSLAAMANEARPIDLVTLQDYLRGVPEKSTGNLLDGIGGIGFLSAAMNATASAGMVEHYLDIVIEKYRMREMLTALARCEARLWEPGGVEINALISGIEAEVFEAGKEGGKQTAMDAHAATGAVIDLLEEHFNRGRGVIGGLPTGFSYLDKVTGGLWKGEMVILAARPSVGKTSLMMNIVEHVAVDGKTPVAVFSLEMKTTDLMMRLLCGRARVNMHRLRTGFAEQGDIPKMTRSAGQVGKAPIWIDDTPSLDVSVFRARARRLKAKHGIGLIVLDYLQLMRDEAAADRNSREREVASIAENLKACAKELDVPVVALSQLNRSTEKERNRRPGLADLRESGQIEQAADACFLLYRPQKKGEEDEDEDGEESKVQDVNLIVAKQRNGPCTDVELLFHKEYMRFEDKCGGLGSRKGEMVAREKLKRSEDEGKKVLSAES